MSMNIPLKLFNKQPSLRSARTNKGLLNLPINISGTRLSSSLFGSDRQTEALRAIAAAASVVQAGEAIKKAKQAKDHPEEVMVPELSDEKLTELIAAVAEVQDRPDSALPANEEQKAAANAVGTRSSLVKAAFDKMQQDDSYRINALAWVAAVDGQLLDSAARESTKKFMLNKVPDKKNLSTLENRIDLLESKVQQLGPLNVSKKTKADSSGKG